MLLGICAALGAPATGWPFEPTGPVVTGCEFGMKPVFRSMRLSSLISWSLSLVKSITGV